MRCIELLLYYEIDATYRLLMESIIVDPRIYIQSPCYLDILNGIVVTITFCFGTQFFEVNIHSINKLYNNNKTYLES